MMYISVMLFLALSLPLQRDQPSQLVVKVSPEADYESVRTLPAELTKAVRHAKAVKSDVDRPSDTYISAQGRRLALQPSYDLYDQLHAESLKLTERAKLTLRAMTSELRTAHYGELMQWEQAKEHLPLNSVLTVTDVETGLRFNVQRRAGSTHADVQPLTRTDTSVMKRIYDGKWSWRRRAVIVSSGDGRRIAGSMHGMPHGGDGIPGNGFSGHFCIHFLGSRTHRTGSVDPDHQVMVYKAAGRLQEYVEKSPPARLAELLVISINQKDSELTAAAFGSRRHAELAEASHQFNSITAIRAEDQLNSAAGTWAPVAEDIPLRAVVYRKASKREATLIIHTRRDAPWQSWRIDGIEIN